MSLWGQGRRRNEGWVDNGWDIEEELDLPYYDLYYYYYYYDYSDDDDDNIIILVLYNI